MLLLNVNERQSQSGRRHAEAEYANAAVFPFICHMIDGGPLAPSHLSPNAEGQVPAGGGCSREIWRWWSCTAHLEPLEHVTLSFLRHSGAAC